MSSPKSGKSSAKAREDEAIFAAFQKRFAAHKSVEREKKQGLSAQVTQDIRDFRVDAQNVPYRWQPIEHLKKKQQQQNYRAQPSVKPFPESGTPSNMNSHKETGKPATTIVREYGPAQDNVELQAKLKERASQEAYVQKHDMFLTLDNSAFPLQVFDTEEETLERFPGQNQKWLDVCTRGQSLLYHNAEWTWSPCSILRYNQSSLKFEIQFDVDSSTKWVKRLDLVFDLEDFDTFQNRVELALSRRECVKSHLRLDHYLEKRLTQSSVSMQRRLLEGIQSKVVDGLDPHLALIMPDVNSSLHGNEGSGQPSLVETLTTEVCLGYRRSVQLSMVQAKIDSSAEFASYVNGTLRCVVPDTTSIIPHFGKWPHVPPHAYARHFAFVQANHCMVHSKVLKVVQKLLDRWQSSFASLLFVSTDTSQLPLKLHEFQTAQELKARSTLDTLTSEWRRQCLDSVLDGLGDVFDFFQSDRHMYEEGEESSPLRRILQCLGCRMWQQLREIVLQSLVAYVTFLQPQGCLEGVSLTGMF